MAIPLFFPTVRYVPHLTLPEGQVSTVRALCEQAGVPCRASGAWCERQVGYQEADEPAIEAEPGYIGAVLITVPTGRTPEARAQWMLAALAYVLFDQVARESIRGARWTKVIETREGIFDVNRTPNESA